METLKIEHTPSDEQSAKGNKKRGQAHNNNESYNDNTC